MRTHQPRYQLTTLAQGSGSEAHLGYAGNSGECCFKVLAELFRVLAQRAVSLYAIQCVHQLQYALVLWEALQPLATPCFWLHGVTRSVQHATAHAMRDFRPNLA
jgi:hypothetical protein